VLDLTVGFLSKNATQSVIAAVRSVGPAGTVKRVAVHHNACIAEHVSEVRSALCKRNDVDNVEHDVSLSVAQGWNQIVLHARTPWVMICNDDVRFDTNWVDELRSAQARAPCALQFNLGYPASSFSAFIVHKQLIHRVGWFDPDFEGIYFEDEDWYLRVSAAYGDAQHDAPHDTAVIAWRGAVENSGRFRAADAARWGGLRGDLRREDNVRAFESKWRDCSEGWPTKGAHRRLLLPRRETRDPFPEVRASYGRAEVEML